MNPCHLFRSLLLALLLHFLPLLFLSYLPSVIADDNVEEYNDCSVPKYCGAGNSIKISYPFNTADRPPYCGYPGLILACNQDDYTVTMNISGRQYEVKSIDYTAKEISITDQSFASSSSCPSLTGNITTSSFRSLYFDDHGDLVNISLYIKCSSDISAYPGTLNSVSCGDQYAYFLSGGGGGLVPDYNCEVVEFVMNQTTFDLLTSGSPGQLSLKQALLDPIAVAWTAEIEAEQCDKCEQGGGICVSNNTCLCPHGLASDNSCPTRKKIGKKPILIAIVAGVTSIVLLAGVVLLLYKRRQNIMLNFGGRSSNHTQNIEELLGDCQYLAPKRYKFSDIKRITKSFSEKLGEGGYGSVYKGALDDGRLVAVKLLSNVKGNGEEFVNEVASIGRTSHVNIVTLIGFCFKGTKRALIYDFMPNGSLERYIYSDTPKVILGWDKLYQIAIGVARGLEYLHRGCNTRIVHFDIKPHNILLDRDFCPKISDFGLAKLSSQNDSFLSMAQARGTIGFIAPEVFLRHFGHVSTKSDVYSYGMLVLEMAGGRRNVNPYAQNTSETYFPDWVYEHLDENDGLQAYGVTTETSDIARKIIIVGLWCIQLVPTSRPSISRVIEMLEGRISDLEIPPKPLLSSESFQDSST